MIKGFASAESGIRSKLPWPSAAGWTCERSQSALGLSREEGRGAVGVCGAGVRASSHTRVAKSAISVAFITDGRSQSSRLTRAAPGGE